MILLVGKSFIPFNLIFTAEDGTHSTQIRGKGWMKITNAYKEGHVHISHEYFCHGQLLVRSAEVGRHEEIPISSKEGNK
jgi:hypothetical protein